MWADPFDGDTTTQAPHRRQLLTDATPGAVDAVHDLLVDLVDVDGNTPEPVQVMLFETALVEIVGNVVRHAGESAHERSAAPQLCVDVRATRTAIEACCRDDGRPARVDLSAVSMPAAESGAESGRGLAMALAIADELTYERVHDINVWRLACRRG